MFRNQIDARASRSRGRGRVSDFWLPNILVNGAFDNAGPPPILQADWSISGGILTKVAGAAVRDARWTTFLQPLVIGATYEISGVVIGFAAGLVSFRFNGGAGVTSLTVGVDGPFTRTMTTIAGSNEFAVRGNATFIGSVDNIALRRIL